LAEEAMKLNGGHIGQRYYILFGRSSGGLHPWRHTELNNSPYRYLELFQVDSNGFEAFKRRMLLQPDSAAGPGNYPLAGQAAEQYGMNQQWGYFANSPEYAAGYGYESYGRRGPQQKQYGASGGGWGGGYGYRYSLYDYHGRSYPAAQQDAYGGSAGGAGIIGIGRYASALDLLTRITHTTHLDSSCDVHMRGVPFRVTSAEIEQFFMPLHCAEIKVGQLEDGRASGDAIVSFNSPVEAHQALARDRQSIGNR